MFLLKNKKNIKTFQLKKKVPYLELWAITFFKCFDKKHVVGTH